MLKDISPRVYQETILNTAIGHNTLVVLPTGMGKTLVGLMLTAHRMNNHPQSKIVFISPTRPLVQQHYNTFVKHLDMDAGMAVFTGHVPPKNDSNYGINHKLSLPHLKDLKTTLFQENFLLIKYP